MANADDEASLIDDIGIARLIAKLRAIRDHDPNYGVTKTEFLARAQEIAVRQAVRDRRRQRKQQQLEVPLDSLLPSQAPAAPSFVDRLIDHMDLCLAIDRLSRHERQVVIQSFVLKLPIREIAASLGLTQKTTRALRASARDKLRTAMPIYVDKGVTASCLSQEGIVGQNGKAPCPSV